METFSAETFAAGLALVGGVILVAALLSGVIERSGLPQVAFFLALGAALGPTGLGVLNINLQSPILRALATLSLVLVLFTDAITLDLKEVRKHSRLALRVLGPGTLLSAALVGLAGWGILGLNPAEAAVIGAALASTDPVLLRGLLRRPDVPGTAKQALRLESGLNDVVLLPIVLVAMVFLEQSGGTDVGAWAKLALDLFLLGPGAGVAVGLLSVATMDLIRRRIGLRRDYESLYSLGVAFTAFAAAEAVHGSGFLAAFAAGLTVSALDVELCDCFLEYGETTAEMALLLTFVLFGGSLIWSGFAILDWAIALFTVITLLIRPVAFLTSLIGVRLTRQSRFLIAWFGPRGLSTLLLVLLPVFENLPGSVRLFQICCLVVLLSIVLHGGTPLFLSRKGRAQARRLAIQATPPAPPVVETPSFSSDGANGQVEVKPPAAVPYINPPTNSPGHKVVLPVIQPATPQNVEEDGVEPASRNVERISLEELRQLWERGEPVIVLDVRSIRTYAGSEWQAQGAIRLDPNYPAREATGLGLPKLAWLVAFCA